MYNIIQGFFGDENNNSDEKKELQTKFNTLESQLYDLKTRVSAMDASIEKLMNKADKNEQDIADLDEKLNQLDVEMKKQFEIIESQFRDLIKQLARVDQRVAVLELNVTSLDTRLTKVDQRRKFLEHNVTFMDRRLTKVEQRATVLEHNVTSLNRRLSKVEKDSVAMAETAAFFVYSRHVLEKFQADWWDGGINTDFFTLLG